MKKTLKQILQFQSLWLFIFLILILTFVLNPKEKKNFNPPSFYLQTPSQASLMLKPKISNYFLSLELPLVKKNSLKSISPPYLFQPETLGIKVGKENFEKNEIKKYIVKKGDTIWSIAEKFKISPQTIKWANSLESSLILPGQKLIILPVDGVLHIVKKGDTVSEIAKKYKVKPKEIIEFNNLSPDGKLFVNEVLIIPGGKIPTKKSTLKENKKSKFNVSKEKFYYPWGYCTFWVEYKWKKNHHRTVPTSWGNAKNWLKRAKNQGYKVCFGRNCPPKVGAIISLKVSNPLGHVAYVEDVKGNVVIFSEMNYYGFGKMNYRRLKIGDKRILGYIY